MVALGLRRPGHLLLRDGPQQVRGRPGPPRRDRPGDRPADGRRGRRAAKAGALQRFLHGVRVRREESRRAGQSLLLGPYPQALRPGRDANPAQLRYWTQAWLDRIRDLYRAHDELMAAWQENTAPAPQSKAAAAARLEKAGRAWDGALTVIDETRKTQAQAPGLAEPAKKALATLDREWDGLAAHRGYPMVSLDNNVAERAIRGPVVTRKNARGSHNGDTARNAAVIWTVTATARMAGLNELTYLTACLDECGRNGGKPLSGPALERFLPWNASPEDLRTWAQPPPDG